MTPGEPGAPSARRLYSLVIVMVFFWALNFVIARVALREFPFLLTASLRVVVAGLALIPLYVWAASQEDHTPWKWSEAPVLLALGVCGVALNQVFFMFGLAHTSTAHAAIMIGLTPILVLVASSVVGHEQITTRKALGMAVALTGIAVLQLARSHQGSTASWYGDLFVFLAAVTFAIFTVVGKPITTRHGGVTVTTFAYVGAGLALLPIAVWQGLHFDFRQVSPQAWMSLSYMALISSALCYLIYYWALTHIPASRLSAMSYLQPVLAMGFGMLLLGESFSGSLVTGASLVLTGVYLTERG